MNKSFPSYMTRGTAARYCAVTDKEFAAAIAAGQVASIPSDTGITGALYRRSDLDDFIAARGKASNG